MKLNRIILAGAVAITASLILTACPSLQSETTVFGIEITTFDSASMMPVGRAGLIRHKNQLTQAGQAQQFYNGESDVNIWKGSLSHGYTGMSCSSLPDSASRNEAPK